jgi:hypothetical protein
VPEEPSSSRECMSAKKTDRNEKERMKMEIVELTVSRWFLSVLDIILERVISTSCCFAVSAYARFSVV